VADAEELLLPARAAHKLRVARHGAVQVLSDLLVHFGRSALQREVSALRIFGRRAGGRADLPRLAPDVAAHAVGNAFAHSPLERRSALTVRERLPARNHRLPFKRTLVFALRSGDLGLGPQSHRRVEPDDEAVPIDHLARPRGGDHAGNKNVAGAAFVVKAFSSFKIILTVKKGWFKRL
jgi:hypothetical protein